MDNLGLRCLSRLRAFLLPQKAQITANRQFSVTPCYQRGKKRYYIKKSPNFFEASRADRYNRNDVQRLFNLAYKKIPFDSKFPVTAKHTGPQVVGGSEEAAKLTAVHAAPVPGYINRKGKFVKVKELEAELIVPDLTGFELKPYVPYKITDIQEPELTPEKLFDKLYAAKIKSEVDSEFSDKEPKKSALSFKSKK